MLVSGSTKVFALFGDPVMHSFSPLMHNTAFKRLKLDSLYVLLSAETALLKL